MSKTFKENDMGKMTPDQIHKIIEEKWSGLIWTIAYKISGDLATSSLEDNYQDLWLAAYEAIEGFTKQHNYTNGPVETWIRSSSFNKYMKTCLWNKKNHKGKQISNKYEIHRDTVPTHIEEALNVCATPSSGISEAFSEIKIILSEVEREALGCILTDPDRFITELGDLKIMPIQKKLKWNRDKVMFAIKGLKKKISGQLY